MDYRIETMKEKKRERGGEKKWEGVVISTFGCSISYPTIPSQICLKVFCSYYNHYWFNETRGQVNTEKGLLLYLFSSTLSRRAAKRKEDKRTSNYYLFIRVPVQGSVAPYQPPPP